MILSDGIALTDRIMYCLFPDGCFSYGETSFSPKQRVGPEN